VIDCLSVCCIIQVTQDHIRHQNWPGVVAVNAKKKKEEKKKKLRRRRTRIRRTRRRKRPK
jgi:hypothetical protein